MLYDVTWQYPYAHIPPPHPLEVCVSSSWWLSNQRGFRNVFVVRPKDTAMNIVLSAKHFSFTDAFNLEPVNVFFLLFCLSSPIDEGKFPVTCFCFQNCFFFLPNWMNERVSSVQNQKPYRKPFYSIDLTTSQLCGVRIFNGF